MRTLHGSDSQLRPVCSSDWHPTNAAAKHTLPAPIQEQQPGTRQDNDRAGVREAYIPPIRLCSTSRLHATVNPCFLIRNHSKSRTTLPSSNSRGAITSPVGVCAIETVSQRRTNRWRGVQVPRHDVPCGSLHAPSNPPYIPGHPRCCRTDGCELGRNRERCQCLYRAAGGVVD